MWMTPTRMRRRPGTPGRIAVVVDVSGSMMNQLQVAAREFRVVAKLFRQFTLIVFADEAREISIKRFERLAQGFYDAETYGEIGGGTRISSGLEAAAALDPQTTVLISDGHCCGPERVKCLSIAKAMTGSIFTFLCGPMDVLRLMEDLARIGNGKCIALDGTPGVFRDALRAALKDAQAPTEQEPSMAREKLPDHLLESDEFDIVAPEDEEHDIRKRIKLITGTVFDVEHRSPEWNYHGKAVSQRIGFEPNRTQISKPQSVFRTALAAFFSAPQIEAPQESYRGQLREAPQLRALSAPSERPLALPAPKAPASYSPVAIADQRGGDMDQGRERVAAILRRK